MSDLIQNGTVIQQGDTWSSMAPQTGWSPQFESREAAVKWLNERGYDVPPIVPDGCKRFRDLIPGDKLKLNDTDEVAGIVMALPQKGTLRGMMIIEIDGFSVGTIRI